MLTAHATAHSNIALVKYWGKRPGSRELNLPAVGSLSMTLGKLRTNTRIRAASASDSFELDGELVGDKPAAKVFAHLDRVWRLGGVAGSRPACTVSSTNHLPTAAGLAYVEAAARTHEQADAAADGGIEVLLAAVELERPNGDGIAEQVHYELLARSAELLVAQGEGERALELLTQRLAPTLSLPVDRAAARCLVSLGDAAGQTGDLSLAMGSYARALDMLTLLLEEMEP